MRASVYLRQSLDRTGEELGVSRQREDARILARLRGWVITAERVDNDTSASGKRRRPGFEDALADLESGRADVLIAWDMTRLTRNARDRLRLIETGKAAGALVAFVRGSDLDLGTPAGRLTADILGSVAQHEIEQKSDRQKRAVEQAAKAGKRVGGRRPFGYEGDGMTLRDVEADALARAYDSVLHGVPVAAIVRELNDAGLFTPQLTRTGEPSRWSAQTFRQVLLNPRYAGIRATSRYESGVKVWDEVAPAQWPSIVPEETWRAVVAILRDPSRLNHGSIGRRLLTGIAVCGVCDAYVNGGGAPGGNRTYRCSASMGHISRKSDPVDEYVSEVVIARLSRPDAAGLLVDRDRGDVEALGREAATLRARLEDLGVSFAEGEIDRRTLASGSARLRERLSAVQARQADAGRVDVLGPLVSAHDVRGVWEALSTDRRRAVVATLLTARLHPVGRGSRLFRPDTVELDWR